MNSFPSTVVLCGQVPPRTSSLLIKQQFHVYNRSFRSTNLHFGQHAVSCWVCEDELEAVRRHLHVSWEDEHHSPLVHVPLGETTFDVGSW